jgi:hypothetical protein
VPKTEHKRNAETRLTRATPPPHTKPCESPSTCASLLRHQGEASERVERVERVDRRAANRMPRRQSVYDCVERVQCVVKGGAACWRGVP